MDVLVSQTVVIVPVADELTTGVLVVDALITDEVGTRDGEDTLVEEIKVVEADTVPHGVVGLAVTHAQRLLAPFRTSTAVVPAQPLRTQSCAEAWIDAELEH